MVYYAATTIFIERYSMTIKLEEERHYKALIAKFSSATKNTPERKDSNELPSVAEFTKTVKEDSSSRSAEMIATFLGKKPTDAINILLDNPELRDALHKKGYYTLQHILPIYLDYPKGKALLTKEFIESLPEGAVYEIARVIGNIDKLPDFLAENKEFTIAVANKKAFYLGNSDSKFASSELGYAFSKSPKLKDFLLSEEFLGALTAEAAGQFFSSLAYAANYDPTRYINAEGAPAFSNPEKVKPSLTKEEYQKARDFLFNKFPAETAFAVLKHEVSNTPEYFHDKDKGPLAFINTQEFLAKIDEATANNLVIALDKAKPFEGSTYPHVFRDFLPRNLPFALTLKTHYRDSSRSYLSDNLKLDLSKPAELEKLQSLITADNALEVLGVIRKSDYEDTPIISDNKELRNALLEADKSSRMFFEVAKILFYNRSNVLFSDEFLSRITPRVADELTANPNYNTQIYINLFANEKFVEKIFSQASNPEKLLVQAIYELYECKQYTSITNLINNHAIEKLDLGKIFEANGVALQPKELEKAVFSSTVALAYHYDGWKNQQTTHAGKLDNTKPHFDFLDKIPHSEAKMELISDFLRSRSHAALNNPDLYKGLQLAYSGKNIAEALKAEAVVTKSQR